MDLGWLWWWCEIDTWQLPGWAACEGYSWPQLYLTLPHQGWNSWPSVTIQFPKPKLQSISIQNYCFLGECQQVEWSSTVPTQQSGQFSDSQAPLSKRTALNLLPYWNNLAWDVLVSLKPAIVVYVQNLIPVLKIYINILRLRLFVQTIFFPFGQILWLKIRCWLFNYIFWGTKVPMFIKKKKLKILNWLTLHRIWLCTD